MTVSSPTLFYTVPGLHFSGPNIKIVSALGIREAHLMRFVTNVCNASAAWHMTWWVLALQTPCDITYFYFQVVSSFICVEDGSPLWLESGNIVTWVTWPRHTPRDTAPGAGALQSVGCQEIILVPPVDHRWTGEIYIIMTGEMLTQPGLFSCFRSWSGWRKALNLNVENMNRAHNFLHLHPDEFLYFTLHK